MTMPWFGKECEMKYRLRQFRVRKVHTRFFTLIIQTVRSPQKIASAEAALEYISNGSCIEMAGPHFFSYSDRWRLTGVNEADETIGIRLE